MNYEKAQRMWDRLAPVWDLTALAPYRKKAVQKLGLEKGYRVLDLACGTGLNFQYLEEKVGGEGKIIGLDYSGVMLEKAKEKVRRNNWKNVELIQTSASDFDLDEEVDGALCTYAMVSISQYRKALEKTTKALREGGKLAVLDFKLTSGLFGRIINPISTAIFRLTYQDATRKPWEEMEKLLDDVDMEEYRFGMIYIASGVKR